MSIARAKKEQLVEEFNVQVYSSGRIHWDRLDDFIPSKEIARQALLNRVMKRIRRSSEPVLA